MCFFFKKQSTEPAPSVLAYQRRESLKLINELSSRFECVYSGRGNYMLYLNDTDTGVTTQCAGRTDKEFWPKALNLLNAAIITDTTTLEIKP